jgi:hypothetical protein
MSDSTKTFNSRYGIVRYTEEYWVLDLMALIYLTRAREDR